MEESYNIVKEHLSLAFYDHLNSYKRIGKPRLTSEEQDDIFDAFDKQDWDRLAEYVQKYFN